MKDNEEVGRIQFTVEEKGCVIKLEDTVSKCNDLNFGDMIREWGNLMKSESTNSFDSKYKCGKVLKLKTLFCRRK